MFCNYIDDKTGRLYTEEYSCTGYSNEEELCPNAEVCQRDIEELSRYMTITEEEEKEDDK